VAMKVHDIVRTCEVSLVLWNPISWQTLTAAAFRILNIIFNKHRLRKSTLLSNLRNDALYMAKGPTAITRNISRHKRLPSSDYRSYFMFGDAGFDVAMFMSLTTALWHNCTEFEFQFRCNDSVYSAVWLLTFGRTVLPLCGAIECCPHDVTAHKSLKHEHVVSSFLLRLFISSFRSLRSSCPVLFLKVCLSFF
jgi:hypothetical protein